jgi:protocatechuate 3,4-dioxygenase alpha subunit
MAKLTPAQTIGPFFHEGLAWAMGNRSSERPADAVRITGRVLDREGVGVSDALLEVWHPAWPSSGIAGLQRAATDDAGRFAFLLPQVRQGQVHANVTLFARGLLRGVYTRVYLQAADDLAALVLPDAVPAGRRATLMARRRAADPAGYEWDVRLSGANETVFFDL